MLERPEIISPLGMSLYARPPASELPQLQKEFDTARSEHLAAPEDLAKLILYGRRMAYLWRYHEAIAIYTAGIEAHPDSALLYRHRGHRYISVRRLEAAEQDLARANELRSDDFDILYHLGLARWLMGDFAGALRPYRECFSVVEGDEHRVAIAYWLYFTLLRLGRHDEAQRHLMDFRAVEAGENTHYYHVLLMLQGQQSESDLQELMSTSDYNLATSAYGVGCWHLLSGRQAEAASYFQRILSVDYWPAFGYIASEVELLRIRRGSK